MNRKQSRLRSVRQRQNHFLSIPGIAYQMLLLDVSISMKICIIDMDLENKESLIVIYHRDFLKKKAIKTERSE